MTTKTIKMEPIHIFAPITRIDDSQRIVEGYCYVNAECGDGYNLTREAMQAAADDYMQWGAVREMHRAVAAGTATPSDQHPSLGVTFDERGAYLRAHIVDDEAWNKVKSGVYRGFSVGVRPITMKGNKVIRCKWLENSLVDRPFDEDAKFSIVRADGIKDDDLKIEYDVEVIATRKELERAAQTNSDPVLPAPTTLPDNIPPDMQALVTRMTAVEASFAELKRTLETERATHAETVKQLNKRLKNATREVDNLSRMAVQLHNPPVIFAGAVDPHIGIQRNFAANEPAMASAANGEALLNTYNQLKTQLESESDANKRQAGVTTLMMMKSTLTEMGMAVD